MKFFVDTADIQEISALAASGLLDGVTTNPSLIARSGRHILEVIDEICSIVTTGPVSAEVAATEYQLDHARGRRAAPHRRQRHHQAAPHPGRTARLSRALRARGP
ncbi:MAG: transaldolase family protein [Thermomicrobiales bacterium]